MSQDTDIRTALETPLFAVAGFPDVDHRAMEAVAFEAASVTEAWARITHFWGQRQLGTLPASGGTLWISGILSVLLLFPVGVGTVDSDTLSDAIGTALPAGKTIGVGGRKLEITECRRGRGMLDPGKAFWNVPIDIFWKFRAQNPTT